MDLQDTRLRISAIHLHCKVINLENIQNLKNGQNRRRWGKTTSKHTVLYTVSATMPSMVIKFVFCFVSCLTADFLICFSEPLIENFIFVGPFLSLSQHHSAQTFSSTHLSFFFCSPVLRRSWRKAGKCTRSCSGWWSRVRRSWWRPSPRSNVRLSVTPRRWPAVWRTNWASWGGGAVSWRHTHRRRTKFSSYRYKCVLMQPGGGFHSVFFLK